MQAIEIRIPGQFWDSFIYNRHLYLFTLDGDIMKYDWNSLINSIQVERDYRPLFQQFLTSAGTWYEPELQKLLESPKISLEVRALAARMAATPFDITAANLSKALVDACSSPAHPHTDVEGFYGTLYLASHGGVYAAAMARRLANNFAISTDIPALRIACSYGSMALAAGSEGMYEQRLMSFDDRAIANRPKQLSDIHCSACSWASFDVVGTAGPGDAGFVAAFTKPRPEEGEELLAVASSSRELLGVIGSNELFPFSDGLLFGAGTLLVMAARSSLFIDGWDPFLRRDNELTFVQSSLTSRRQIAVDALTDDAIDGAATVFGIVVEMDRGLLVRGTDGSITAFGEPVNWRTYPRSRRYFNQLHITQEGYVSIYAFFEDYFIPAATRESAVHRPGSKR